jgi:cytochrome c peroxidase
MTVPVRALPHPAPATAAAALSILLTAVSAGAQLGPPPDPPGNPTTPGKANLGKVLFWDEQLSSTRTVACGTCHIPSGGGDDPRSATDPLAVNPGPDGVFGNDDDVLGSPGVPLSDASGVYLLTTHFGLTEQTTGRRTLSSINAGYSPELFWDGRAAGEFRDPVTDEVVLASGAALESQAVGPIVSDVEMGHLDRMWSEAITRLEASEPLALAHHVPLALIEWIDGRDYPDLFLEAFGTAEVTAARVGMAIASYERTQFTDQSPFDLYLATGNVDVFTEQEELGLNVFSTANCNSCHTLLPLQTDHSFRYTGVRPPAEDPGRFEVTLDPDDLGRMRTPSLRNVELRAPYMHNGRFATLEEVIDFYDRGGDFDAPNKDPAVHELRLTRQQKDDLLAFLTRPLTDPRLVDEQPPFDRPRLYTESGRVPVVEGAALQGTVPQPVVLEPPLLGNPSFTVGVHDALGGADALLVIDGADPGLTPPASGDLAFEKLVLDGVGPGNGYGSVSLAIPSDPSFAGSEWLGRWYVDEGETTAVSPLFRFTIFPSLGQSLLYVDGFESGSTAGWSAAVP